MGGVLQAFAIIVIVFAVIERVNARKGGSSLPDEAAWDGKVEES